MKLYNYRIEAGDGGFATGLPSDHVNKRWHIEYGTQRMGVEEFLGLPDEQVPVKVKETIIDLLAKQGESREKMTQMTQRP